MSFRPPFLLAGALALLAGCSEPEEPVAADPVAVATPEVVLTQAPVPTAAPDGTALTPGRWDVSEDGLGARAVFNGPDGAAIMTIACNPSTREVTLTRAGAASEPVSLRLDAGGQAARLDMTPSADGSALTAAIEPSSPVFVAFSSPETAIAFTGPDGVTSQFPTNSAITRVFERCS